MSLPEILNSNSRQAEQLTTPFTDALPPSPVFSGFSPPHFLLPSPPHPFPVTSDTHREKLVQQLGQSVLEAWFQGMSEGPAAAEKVLSSCLDPNVSHHDHIIIIITIIINVVVILCHSIADITHAWLNSSTRHLSQSPGVSVEVGFTGGKQQE